MKDAIAHGKPGPDHDDERKIILLSIQGEEKKKLTVKQLLDKFEGSQWRRVLQRFRNSRIEIHNLFLETAADWFTI